MTPDLSKCPALEAIALGYEEGEDGWAFERALLAAWDAAIESAAQSVANVIIGRVRSYDQEEYINAVLALKQSTPTPATPLVCDVCDGLEAQLRRSARDQEDIIAIAVSSAVREEREACALCIASTIRARGKVGR